MLVDILASKQVQFRNKFNILRDSFRGLDSLYLEFSDLQFAGLVGAAGHQHHHWFISVSICSTQYDLHRIQAFIREDDGSFKNVAYESGYGAVQAQLNRHNVVCSICGKPQDSMKLVFSSYVPGDERKEYCKDCVEFTSPLFNSGDWSAFITKLYELIEECNTPDDRDEDVYPSDVALNAIAQAVHEFGYRESEVKVEGGSDTPLHDRATIDIVLEFANYMVNYQLDRNETFVTSHLSDSPDCITSEVRNYRDRFLDFLKESTECSQLINLYGKQFLNREDIIRLLRGYVKIMTQPVQCVEDMGVHHDTKTPDEEVQTFRVYNTKLVSIITQGLNSPRIYVYECAESSGYDSVIVELDFPIPYDFNVITVSGTVKSRDHGVIRLDSSKLITLN